MKFPLSLNSVASMLALLGLAYGGFSLIKGGCTSHVDDFAIDRVHDDRPSALLDFSCLQMSKPGRISPLKGATTFTDVVFKFVWRNPEISERYQGLLAGLLSENVTEKINGNVKALTDLNRDETCLMLSDHIYSQKVFQRPGCQEGILFRSKPSQSKNRKEIKMQLLYDMQPTLTAGSWKLFVYDCKRDVYIFKAYLE